MARVYLEFIDMEESYSFTCTWSAIAIFLAVVCSCLKVSTPGGSSLKDSWAISGRVMTWNVPVRLMTIRMILTSDLRVLCVLRASLRGS